MGGDRKSRSVWPWVIALLIGLPVLYVASFGPACWLSSRTGIGRKSLPAMYRPMLMLMKIDDSPADVRHRITTYPLTESRPITLYFYPSGVVSKYASWFAAENWEWRQFAVFENQPDPVVRITDGSWEWRDATQK